MGVKRRAYSRYSVPIECTERDAPYVLDGLLSHESDLDPEEHYTDTHGYVELNFAAFPMFITTASTMPLTGNRPLSQ
jgi:TnpA family transposase